MTTAEPPSVRGMLPTGGRLPALLRGLVRRIPFTLVMVTAIITTTAVTRTMMRPITPDQLDDWGFGLAALREGRLQQILFAPLQVYRPYMVVTISTSLLVFLGACEYVLGTRRALIAFWVGHIAGYLGTFLLLWPLEAAGVGWAERMTREADVGASAAGFAVAGVVLPFLPTFPRRLGFMGLAAYLLGLLMLDRQVWDIEHVIAFLVGVGMGMVLARLRGDGWPSLLAMPRFSRRQQPAIAAWAVGVMGLVNILTAFLSPRHRGLVWLEDKLPLGITHASRHLILVLGFVLVVLALGLARGRRQAWRLTVLALGSALAAHLAKGIDLHDVVLTGAVLALLLRWRAAFVARTDPPSVRQALVTLAVLAVLLPLYGIAGFFILRYQYTEVYSVAAALRETAARLLFSNAGEYAPETHRAAWFLDSIPVLGWTGLLACIGLLLRGVFAHHPTIGDLERARQILVEHGQSGTAYMTLWPGNAIFFGPGRAAYIGYRQAAGVAVALGDPIGPASAMDATIAAFEQFCREQGWGCCFYAATSPMVPHYTTLGYRTLKIGEEAVLPLPHLEFKGKDWQHVRSAFNRAAREGIIFRLYAGGEVPSAVRQQLFALSEAWLKSRALPEMGFTLGTTADVDDPNVMVAVALDGAGRVHGFVDWLPMYAARGWVIDLMRRDPAAMTGIMDFLIGSSLLAFKEQGYAVVSLAAAPLANVHPDPDAPPLSRVLTFVSERFDRFYHFQSLFAFKKKFQPQWQGVYLVYRSTAELPRIALAILRAHLPDLGPRMVAEVVGARVMERFSATTAGRTAAPDGAEPP